MGISKSDIFTDEQNEVATIAKALGHPARIAILQYLLQQKGCICGEIVNEVGLAQATISQHLKELKKAGLIKGTIAGTSTCYCIHTENWERFKRIFQDFFSESSTHPIC